MIHDKINKVHHCNFLENDLPDKSVQLIIADPPYYKVKGDFDFVWKTFDDYLRDVEKWAIECKRLLADNGTLFWWGDAKKVAYSQVIIDKYFTLLNNAVWKKKECRTLKSSIENMRSFIPITERLLMYSNESDRTGLEQVKQIMPNPFSEYLKSEFSKANVSKKEISLLFPSNTGGFTGCVYNWLKGDNIITKDQYIKIRDYLNGKYLRREYEDLRREYEDLRREYEDLRREYEDLRRPFMLKERLTDVLEFSQDAHLSKAFDHPTKKPEGLTRTLIQICSKPSDIVLIPFSGSGTECAMAAKEGRQFIGYDIDNKYVDMANKRCDPYLRQNILFSF